MKLTWRDIVTSLLVIAGGAVVYAKFYSYTWAVIGGSWRNAVAALAILGLAMVAVTGFELANHSWLNMGEMVLGLIAAGLIIAGLIVTNHVVFYSLAVVLGVLWLVSTARHARHSILHNGTTTLHYHASAH